MAFPTPDSLKTFQGYTPNPKKLADEVVKEDYIVLTQYPTYSTDPRWRDEATRQAFVKRHTSSPPVNRDRRCTC